MEIDINNTEIQINLNSNEKIFPYVFSQFEFYGLNRTKSNSYVKNCIRIENELIVIITFLENEKINFKLSADAQKIVKKYHQKIENHKILLDKAISIKNGVIEEDSFIVFLDFLKTLPRKLKNHQIKAAYHLYSIKNGANFSVPGSGKTTVILSVYEKLKLEGKVNVLFVVGPPSSFQPWQHEFKQTLGREPRTKILSGGNKAFRTSEYYTTPKRASELYLTTFQSILRDSKDVIYFFNQYGLEPFFVIDEAHYMKQVGGSWANSLLEIAQFSKFRCVLTGTPIPKSYKDIFNLFDFLYPNNSPLEDEDKIQIDIWEKEKKNDFVKDLLKSKIGPLFYRVRKKDLGLKEPIFHPPILIKMNNNEKKIYELINSKIYHLSSHDYIHNEEILTKLWRGRMIRIRQCISYPKLLLKSINNYKEDLLEDNSDLIKLIQEYDSLELPSKLETLISILKEHQKYNHKVVIWSNFIGTLELMKKQLSKNSMKCGLIYGKTPISKMKDDYYNKEKTREEIRDEFVDLNSGLDILIANPAAAAESISLHKTCFHSIYYDLSYNAAQYLQSLDRIHRVGGSETNTANYYFLQYEKSLDQDIKRNLELKANKMYSIIDEDYEIYNLDMFEETLDDDVTAYKRIFHK